MRLKPKFQIIFLTLVGLMILQSCDKSGSVWHRAMTFGQRAMDERRYKEAERSFLVALEEAEKFEDGDERLPATLITLAEFHRQRNKFKRSKPYYERALELREKYLGMDDTLVVSERNKLVQLYYILGEYAKAESLGTVAISISERVYGKDHLELAELYRNLAETYQEEKRFNEADSLYRRALAVLENHAGDVRHDIALILNNMGVFYHDWGRFAEAESLYYRSLTLNEELAGPNSLSLMSGVTNQAKLQTQVGNHARAESLYTRALNIFSANRTRSYFKKIELHNKLAETCTAQGKYKKARIHYKKALEFIDTGTGMHPDLITILENYADLLRKQGKTDDAVELKQRASRLRKTLKK